MELPAEIAQKLNGKNVIVFDGVCVLCNAWVKFTLRFDKHDRFHFVVAQTDLGEEIYQNLNLKSEDYDTFIVVSGGRIHTKLDGVFALFSTIGFPWKILSVGRFLPGFLKNAMYDLVAKNRYSLFGKQDVCMIPTPDIRARFLS